MRSFPAYEQGWVLSEVWTSGLRQHPNAKDDPASLIYCPVFLETACKGSISSITGFLGKSSVELNPPQKCLYFLITLHAKLREDEDGKENRITRAPPVGTAFKISCQYSEQQSLPGRAE